MAKINSTTKILIGVLVLVVLAGAGYYFFFMGNPNSVIVYALTPTDDGQVGQEILDLVQKLDKVSIQSNLFATPLFTSLRDLEANITPETQGRGNPFAPIGNESGSVVTKTATKTVAQ
jgi:flagellar basal body-associated protein FliL